MKTLFHPCGTPFHPCEPVPNAARGIPPCFADPDDADGDEWEQPEPEEEPTGPPVNEQDAAYDPDMVPGIFTGEDVVQFYGKYGQDSPVKFFYCNRRVEPRPPPPTPPLRPHRPNLTLAGPLYCRRFHGVR